LIAIIGIELALFIPASRITKSISDPLNWTIFSAGILLQQKRALE
jgi:hypothetical protein